MIYLLFILQFANAANWMRVDDIKLGLTRGFELKASCEVGSLDEKIDIISQCPVIIGSSTRMEDCVIKVPKNIKFIDCPTLENSTAKCPINISCVEIGSISPDVVGVNELVTPPVATINPIKQSEKDLKELEKTGKESEKTQAEVALKSLPKKIPDSDMSDAIRNILTILGL